MSDLPDTRTPEEWLAAAATAASYLLTLPDAERTNWLAAFRVNPVFRALVQGQLAHLRSATKG